MKVLPIGALLLAYAALLHGSTPEATGDLQIVVANDEGSHIATKLPLADAQLARAKHLWAWTAEFPPQRLLVQDTSPEPEWLMKELRRAPVRKLAVRVRGWSSREELASLRIIVAPVEMWNSVPEPLLPAFPISETGHATIAVRDPARIRVVGNGVGTMWQRISPAIHSIEVALRRPAIDAEMTFRSSDGGPTGRLFALVMSRDRGTSAPTVRARFAAEDREVLRISALPESEIITLFVITEHAAPHMLSGTAKELSRMILLPKPAEIRGRFVDEENRGINDVKVEVEGWVSPDAPVASRNDTVSDEAGSWTVAGLPRISVILRASVPGRSTFRKHIALTSGDVDLGTIVLQRSTDVVLGAFDIDERPLPNVNVETDSGFSGRTNKEGSITLANLPSSETTAVTVSADGYAKRTIHLTPPLPKEERVVLERTFSVRGSLVSDSGIPVSDGTVVITTGASYRHEIIGPEGHFSFDVRPGEDFELTFESLTAASITRKEPPGQPGEVRDLGTIRLPTGLSVRGRVIDPASAPVAGARVWAIRPSTGGVVTAWASGRFVQAVTAANGSFELRGLAAGPTVLRVDAADFARSYRDILVEPGSVDLGAIELTRGRTVVVRIDRPDGMLARLDLRGHSLDADMLTAPVIAGEAQLRHVPPGRYEVTVVGGHSVICDRHVAVDSSSDSTVECPPPMNVRGRVKIGGTPAFGGTLTWVQPGRTDALINTRLSPIGAMQQRLYGLGGGVVAVSVGPDGMFESDQLRSGEWQVAWRSVDGVGTPNRPFNIPASSRAELVIEFDGGVIRGRVLDEDGKPVPGARVREIQGPLHAMAAGDGSFTITAVPSGPHRLQATLGPKASQVAHVSVEPGKQVPEVSLKIVESERNVLSVRVIGVEGEAKANAFVFVELIGGVKTVTTDASGVATVGIAEGLPDFARLLAFADNGWAFAAFRRSPAETSPPSITVRFERTGALRIRSQTVSGTPALLTPRSPADLAWALGRIGWFVSVTPQSPLVIQGLPSGTYEIGVGSHRAVVSVIAGSTVTADLP